MLWWPSSSGEQTSHSPGAIRSLGLSGETCRPSGPPSGQEEQGGISRAHYPGYGTAGLRDCGDASPPPAELRGALEHRYSKPGHEFLVAADHGVELSDDVVALAAEVVQCLAPHAMMLPREGWEG